MGRRRTLIFIFLLSPIPFLAMKRIAILNGPNLDRLGKREPEIYGHTTLAELESQLSETFADAAELICFQSNHEGALVDKISESEILG